MSQKKNKHESLSLHGNGGKKMSKSSEDSKLRANVISKLCDNFQDSFDLALIASVAHTCQWDISRATEALLLLGGGKKNSKKNKNSKGEEKEGSKNKAKSLPGTLKQEKSRSGKRKGSVSPIHYSSTNSLSSSQVWQRHYKSKPQSPGLLTMIPSHNKDANKQKKNQTYSIVPKPKSQREITAKQKMISEVKKVGAEVKKILHLIKNGVKVMIIMRGAPGSGKTHFAQCIVGLVTGNEMSQHILSTDDYFIMLGRGNYAYDYNQLPQAHNWNQKRVSEALKRGINPIIVDNTNIQAWEMHPYVVMAVEHGYVIEVFEPVTEWKNKEAELAKRNIHSVPREKIRQMLERYEPGWTGEKLLKSFGLKYKNSGSSVVTQEKRPATNILLAQHRQNAVVDAPEKPKRKKSTSKKKDRHNLAGIEITEDKEKQLEELKNLFAEYGKKMNSSTKQKVLESGVPIAEVVSRMRKLQGNVLPLPNQSIPSALPETDFPKNVLYNSKTIQPVPNFSSPRKDSFAESVETDTMSSSNASETSECETDTEINMPNYNEMKNYFGYGDSGHFVDGEDLMEDYDNEDNANEHMIKDEGAAAGLTSRSQISSSQEELSLIDFGTHSVPASSSPFASFDNLNILDFAGIENQPKDSSSSSEEEETQMLSLQESLREVLIDKRSSDDLIRKKNVEKENNVISSENIVDQSVVEITDSLKDALGRRFEKTSKSEFQRDSEEAVGGVSINDSLLQMLVKKYSSEETQEKTEKDTSAIPTKDLFLSKKSPDLEQVPLPSIPPEQKNTGTGSDTLSKTSNFLFDWCGTKTDKFEDIVNSWEYPQLKESKPDNSPKQARPKNALLGAIKKTVVQPREKSPEEVLRSADLGWSSISFDSWEDVRKKPTESESSNYPKAQRKTISKIDSSTNTSLADFDLWKEEGTKTLKLNTCSRNINPNYKDTNIPIAFKSDILMLDKGSMTIDTEDLELMSEDNGLENLSGMFPNISKEYLSDILEKCKGNILWAIEVLLETPQNLSKSSELPPTITKPPSYNEAKAMGDPELPSFHNVVIADGKKTIKRKKDKKNCASELSLMLKKQIEESVQINEDLYQDKTLFLKKLRHGEIEFGDEPILPERIIPEKVKENFEECNEQKEEKKEEEDEEEEEEEEEEMIPMKLDPTFFEVLTRQFGVPDSSSNEKQTAMAPVINIPISLAQNIYDCWLDTVNRELEEMQSAYDKMVKEDELLATALQEQEFEYRQPDLREIMDMELAMLLYKQEQAHLHENSRETLATKLSKQLLFEAYPNMDKKMLLDLFESEGRSFEKVVNVLETQENKTPLTVIAPEFLAIHGNKLMEQAKSENLFKEKTEPTMKRSIIVVKENTKKKQDEENVLVVNPAEYRQKIAHLQQQRNECCHLAQEAFRKKSFAVASYFSHMASLYKERIKKLDKELFQSSVFEEKKKSDTTKIDLHFLTVREAVRIVDLFLDHHINQLRKKNESTVWLDMITGRGKHSNQGKSKLKPAVELRLKQRDLSYCEVNLGMLNVTVHKKDLLTEEM